MRHIRLAIMMAVTVLVISCGKNEDYFVGTKWYCEGSWDTEDLGYDRVTNEEKLFPVHIEVHEMITFNNDKYLTFDYWTNASYDKSTCEMSTSHWRYGDKTGKYRYYIKGKTINVIFSETDAYHIINIEKDALYDVLNDMRMIRQ